jgi:hypothetical protein
VPFSCRDWSREVLRACPGLAIDFEEYGDAPARSVAIALVPGGLHRPITVDEIALLSALASPRGLPRGLAQHIRGCDQLLGRLVFDGLVEVMREGAFYSGISAIQTDTESDDASKENNISEVALRYAIAVRHLDKIQLANRLYTFNSFPRRRRNRRDSGRAFADLTGIDGADPSPRIGGREWTAQPTAGWIYFRRGTSTGSRFKLYFCPRPSNMARALPSFAETLGRARNSVFKIAFPAESCVRADKIVAYFPSFAALQQCVANLLVHASLDVEAQAVPFSATIPGTSLLSWGVDPPNLEGRATGSWRSWLTRQVAESVHSIPPSYSPEKGLLHVKAALRLRDIDPVQWLPMQHLLSRKWSMDL